MEMTQSAPSASSRGSGDIDTKLEVEPPSYGSVTRGRASSADTGSSRGSRSGVADIEESIESVFQRLAPGKPHKWRQWIKQLSFQDIDSPQDIITLRENVIDSLPISGFLKNILLMFKEQSVGLTRENVSN